MSASITRSQFLRKRPVNCAVLGEWTCFKRREDLMVLLADVARIQDTGLVRESFGFSMNAFVRLWNSVGYLLSSSEEGLIQNATEENMHLLPYDDALEFITQHLTRPGKLLLKIFNPQYKGSTKPTTETVLLEPLTENDGPKLESSDDSSDCSERSPEVRSDEKARLRAGSKRAAEASLNDSTESDRNRKKSKTGNSDLYSLSLLINDSCPNNNESFLSFTKTFLEKKQFEKDMMMKQIEGEQQARVSREARIKELEVQFQQQLEQEKEHRREKEETIKVLQEELQISNSKRQALEDKLQGIKQFLQVDPDKVVTSPC